MNASRRVDNQDQALNARNVLLKESGSRGSAFRVGGRSTNMEERASQPWLSGVNRSGNSSTAGLEKRKMMLGAVTINSHSRNKSGTQTAGAYAAGKSTTQNNSF